MKAFRRTAHVSELGAVEITGLPALPGTEVEVLVLLPDPAEDVLLQAAESSLDFWDNAVDDEVWDDVAAA